MPDHWWGHVAVDVKRQVSSIKPLQARDIVFVLFATAASMLTSFLSAQATHGCGDLIFSSHTTFALMGALTYHEYGTHLATKVGHAPQLSVFSVPRMSAYAYIKVCKDLYCSGATYIVGVYRS